MANGVGSDAVSSATHLVAAVWALFATLVLLRVTRGHVGRRWSIVVYGVSMVTLYVASGLFHGFRHLSGELSTPLQKLDKSAVFLLIAGSQIPVFVYLLHGRWRFWTVAVTLGLTAVGIVLIWVFPSLPHAWLVGVYAGMGLSGLIPFPKFLPVVGWKGMRWVTVFGGAYLGGALFEVLQWPVLIPGVFGPHEILHVADVVGTLAHFSFMIQCVIPCGLAADIALERSPGAGYTGRPAGRMRIFG